MKIYVAAVEALRKKERGVETQAHFRWGSTVQFPRNQFGVILSKLNPWVGPLDLWSLAWFLILQINQFGVILSKLNPWVGPLDLWSLAWFLILQIKALLLALFFGLNQLIFAPKQVPCRFSLNLPLFGLGPSSTGLGTHSKLSTNNIAWIHWCLGLGPSSKVALSLLPKLVEKVVWVPLISFCKISFLVMHLMPSHAKTGRSCPLIAWLYG